MKRERYLFIGIAVLLIVVSALIITNYNKEPVSEGFALLQANSQAWGLGKKLNKYVSNNRPYEWYVDQATTGDYASINCGPSSVVMAALWADESFSLSTKEQRELIPAAGGYYYLGDITFALGKHDIPYKVVPIRDYNTLVDILDSGAIAILNNEMGPIPINLDVKQRVQRFYTFSGGHYFVLKGYAIVDGNLFFQVYDPNSYGRVYEDGQPKGKDRYYGANVLMTSVMDWWPNAVVVYPLSDDN